MIVPLTPDSVRQSLDGGATIVDAREAPEFSGGHPLGALCVPYSARGFGSRIRVAESNLISVVLTGLEAADLVGAERQLDELGIAIAGFAPGKLDWWAEAGVRWQNLPELPIDGLVASAETVVVDVREQMEWETGYVPGAMLVPLGDVHARAESIPRDRDVVIICEAGIRSATAASILQRAGYTNVAHAPLGTAGIRRHGGALQFPQRANPEAT